jgi:hypothetical protein
MATGLYPDLEIVERFLASVSASTITQRFIAPCDLDVIGMLLFVSTAPGTNNGVAVNISNVPTSQVTSVPAGAANQAVTNPYNLWTAANVPTILGTATTNGVTSAPAVVANKPYALNYPLPGPSGTTGYFTAQSTSSGTSLPVTSPPSFYEYQLNALTAPDNTYTDLNNQTLTPASRLHAGDVLSFVITAAGSGASVGSAANLEIAVYCNKA